ncbi:glycoside hydrolase family 43 protein [Massilia pseudoviolaceinigra]|uniref:glycoside hydrolase family 43 protein n=1 Tax=Massilia pseudoviolaceinigra TaxID=3057165 RepID=UPI0027969641|nr:glycoside hydrolase 43 family protein [Massilia sp. CCM 9206]MDQ1919184.1 glycoside hydrolase 43 family protein [Massilia sp. CCM 9206]
MKLKTNILSTRNSASIAYTIVRSMSAFLVALAPGVALAQAQNPIMFADVPDAAMIRVGNNYYMSSTTMHMNPGVPIMKSTDLVNWKLINYAYDTLADVPELNLTEGKSIYGRGSWASSLRYHKGMYYVSTFAHDVPGETYIFKTKDIEKGNWQRASFKPAYHDGSLFFDDDGKAYLIHGADVLKIVELNDELTGVKQSVPEKILIENASAPCGKNASLAAEGSQLFKVKGKYYLFNICAPANWGMRTAIIHRADNINGPWEGKVGLQDLGVAQGGLIDTPDGRWFAYLFRDFGAVGRIPYLVPVTWESGWPVLGDNGKVPEKLNLPASQGLIPNLVVSDEFNRKNGEEALPLAWQWNHNPDNSLWSVSDRKGYLRLKTGRIDTDFLLARNTLTQRTIGPTSSASVVLDISKMKDGDFAGLSAFQKEYGSVGVKVEREKKAIVMIATDKDKPVEAQRIALHQSKIYLKIDCDFTNKKDEANFHYSLDGKVWKPIGETFKMKYTIPHFMGYRFALFNYATKNTGGYADFDWFRIKY